MVGCGHGDKRDIRDGFGEEGTGKSGSVSADAVWPGVETQQ